MPNTLAHLGVQAVVTRAIIRGADEKWIYIGAVLPDVGWILHRIVQRLAPDLDAYEVRLYASAQTSLFVTLLLAAGLSLFTRRPRLTFTVLSLNAVVHLVLDALEIKWGNGVILFAPFEWQMWNWGQVWPEEWPVQMVTLLGLVYFLISLPRTVRRPLGLRWPAGHRVWLAAGLIAAYLVLPWTFRDAALSADVHYVQTLRNPLTREAAYVEVDRGEFYRDEVGGVLEFFAQHPVRTIGIELQDSATVSVRGRFIAKNTVAVHEYHEHRGPNRDLATLAGLAMVLMLVVTVWVADVRRSHRSQPSS